MLFWTALALLAISIIFALMVPLMIANPRTVLGLWPGIAMPFGGPAIIVLTGALVQFFWRLDYTKTKETLLTLLEPCTLQEPTTPDNGPADR